MPRLGATPDHARRLQIAKLRAKGLTFAAIGRKLGISRQVAYILATRHATSGNSEARCKVCRTVIVSGVRADKTSRDAYCLACLAKRPEASFGARLKAYRLAAGLSRSELAQVAGVRYSLITGYENEARKGSDPQWSKLKLLVRVLGVGLLGLDVLSPGAER